MVIEVINTQEIHPNYMKINNWIKYGISDDARDCCIAQWKNKLNIISSFGAIRNRIATYIKPVNKW